MIKEAEAVCLSSYGLVHIRNDGLIIDSLLLRLDPNLEEIFHGVDSDYHLRMSSLEQL